MASNNSHSGCPVLTYREAFLRFAAELEALASGLNTSSEECSCCGANRFLAYDEELAARKLLGWADALQNLANAVAGRRGGSTPSYLSRPAPLLPAAK